MALPKSARFWRAEELQWINTYRKRGGGEGRGGGESEGEKGRERCKAWSVSGEGGSKGEGQGPSIDYVRQLLHYDCSRKLAR